MCPHISVLNFLTQPAQLHPDVLAGLVAGMADMRTGMRAIEEHVARIEAREHREAQHDAASGGTAARAAADEGYDADVEAVITGRRRPKLSDNTKPRPHYQNALAVSHSEPLSVTTIVLLTYTRTTFVNTRATSQGSLPVAIFQPASSHPVGTSRSGTSHQTNLQRSPRQGASS